MLNDISKNYFIGGLIKEIKIENIYNESVKKISIPSDDLEIIKYSWDSKVKYNRID